MTPQQSNIESKQVVSNDVIEGTVFQTVTILHKNLDTGEWFPVERMTQSTGKNVEEFKASLQEMKAETEAKHLENIKYFDDAVAEVDAAVAEVKPETKK